MLDWLLRHTGGLLDWLAVLVAVGGLVLLIQGMINFYTDPEEPEE